MDPISQRMLALRADMTPQIARIATTRLRNAPRPLRLSYAGDVLRVRGAQLRPERQFAQIGIELIGAPQAAADAEVVLLAVEALAAVGVARLSIDLCSPILVPAVCAGLGIGGAEEAALRPALDRKNAAEVAAAAGQHGELFSALLDAAGPAEDAVAALAALELPPAAREAADRLAEVSALLTGTGPGDGGADLQLTIDPVENRGFEYHTGVTFTLFAPGIRGELGSGGCYLAGAGAGEGAEPATGATLYLTTVMRAVPGPAEARRVYLPAGTPAATASRLRQDGWVTVAGLGGGSGAGGADADAAAEARRLGCGHVLAGGKPEAVG